MPPSLQHKMIRLVLLIAVLLGLIGVWQFAGTYPPTEEENRFTELANLKQQQWEALLAQQFAGDAACASCHPEESAAHMRSGHSHTAFRMEQSALAKQLAGTSYRDGEDGRTVHFTANSSGFYAEVSTGQEAMKQRVDWLLGSGTHAQTAVSITESGTAGLEHCWTWFADREELNRTPGQTSYHPDKASLDSCGGREMSTQEVTHCFGCHMTFGPAPGQSLAEVKWQPNISCERCHGPRRIHAEAALQGRAEEAKPMVTLKNPAVEMDLCAQCHRGEEQIDSSLPEHDAIRFQPYRLQQSKCFQDNPSALTCVTCHDPHDKTSHEITLYEQVCMNCHSQPDQSHCGRDQSQDQAGDNCIRCHMPKREWNNGVQFVDHWIRVLDEQKGDN